MPARRATEESRKTAASPAASVAAARDALRHRAKRLQAAATALGPLTKEAVFGDLKKLGATLEKVAAKLPMELQREADIEALWRRLVQHHTEAGHRMRAQLGGDLKRACAAAGLEFRVVSREDPIELRLRPLALVIDFERGQASLRFARQEIATCPAEAEAIVKAHATALRALGTKFDPMRFFEKCQRAWHAARAARGGEGDRVEILDFLPYLAIEMQTQSFRVAPTKAKFKDYDRARFAWDVLRLRRARGLAQNGYRLNLGVATGTTASQKKRVVYFEDEDGNGEYKLTVFFTREKEIAP